MPSRTDTQLGSLLGWTFENDFESLNAVLKSGFGNGPFIESVTRYGCREGEERINFEIFSALRSFYGSQKFRIIFNAGGEGVEIGPEEEKLRASCVCR